MKKKFIASILTAALALSVLTACGSDAAETAQTTETTTEEAATEETATEEAAPAEEEEAATEEAAPAESKGTITVAASATPHAEILEQVKPILAEQGWDLEVTVFDDYVQPNLVVESGEFDANYFQHIPYLESVSYTHLTLPTILLV